MKKIFTYTLLALFAVNAFANTNGFMLRPNGPLREDRGNGGVEWAVAVPAGTMLVVEDENPVLLTMITEKDRFENIKFYKVSYDKKTYYARESEVALGNSATVILSDTTLFAKPSISAFINGKIEQASIIVSGNKTDKNGCSFTEIQYWSDSGNEIRKRYVFSEKVSGNKNDLDAVRVVDTAVALRNKDAAKEKAMKEELFRNAKKIPASREILNYIQSEYDKLYGEIEVEPFYAAIFSDDGANINVRKSPVNGEVAGQLSDGREVLVFKKSAETSTIEGTTDCWYFINELAAMSDDALEGWVFGKYIKFEMTEKDARAQAEGLTEASFEDAVEN